MSIGFDRSRNRRRDELTNNKNIKGIFHVRIYLKIFFGFAQHQEKATYGLGQKLTLTRSIDNAVLNKGNAINNGKNEIIGIEWYVPHYTPSLDQYRVLMKQIVDKTPKQLRYPERSVFMKEVNTQNLWTFELGTQEGLVSLFGHLQFSDKVIENAIKISETILFVGCLLLVLNIFLESKVILILLFY